MHGEPLCDEMTLAECCIRDRDKIELARRPADGDGAAPGGSAHLEPVLATIEACAKQLDEYEEQVRRAQPIHQELFTRLLERLDGLNLDGLSEDERAFVRGQRKGLVQRTEAVSAHAAAVAGS